MDASVSLKFRLGTSTSNKKQHGTHGHQLPATAHVQAVSSVACSRARRHTAGSRLCAILDVDVVGRVVLQELYVPTFVGRWALLGKRILKDLDVLRGR